MLPARSTTRSMTKNASMGVCWWGVSLINGTWSSPFHHVCLPPALFGEKGGAGRFVTDRLWESLGLDVGRCHLFSSFVFICLQNIGILCLEEGVHHTFFCVMAARGTAFLPTSHRFPAVCSVGAYCCLPRGFIIFPVVVPTYIPTLLHLSYVKL